MRSALFQFFTIKAMTIENIESHMAYTCKCGGVNFALLKSGAIECNKCSTPLDDVKWWAGGMGAQLTRAIKAEDERDALKAALPVGELTPQMHLLDTPEPDKYVDCGEGRPLPMFHLSTLLQYGARLAAARSQPVREPLISCRCFDDVAQRLCADKGKCSRIEALGITKKGEQ